MKKEKKSRNILFPELAIVRNHSYRNKHLLEIAFSSKTYFPEYAIARMCIWPKLRYIFPKTYVPKIYTSQNLHLAENLFSRNYYFPEFACAIIYIWPKLHFFENFFLEFTIVKNCNWQKLYIPKSIFSRNCTFSPEIYFTNFLFFPKIMLYFL